MIKRFFVWLLRPIFLEHMKEENERSKKRMESARKWL
jgi:hypothetical protein